MFDGLQYQDILKRMVEIQQIIRQNSVPYEVMIESLKDIEQAHSVLNMMVEDGILNVNKDDEYAITMKGIDLLGFILPVVLSNGIMVMLDNEGTVTIEDANGSINCDFYELKEALDDLEGYNNGEES